MPPNASSVLDTLRAIARTEATHQPSEDERNEKYEETPRAAPRRRVNSFPSFISLPESTDRQPRPEWAAGYVALHSMPPPTGFSHERWRRVVLASGKFLARWAADADRLGWDTLDVFGAHETAPAARFDCMGLVLLLDRREVVAIDPEGADLVTVTGARQRFRRRPPPPGTVSLWQLRR
jgi:hypothetical protein